jgi:hypothetical protein
MFRQWLSPVRARTLGRILRGLLLAALGLTAVALLVLFVHQGILPVLAWIFPSLETTVFELGVYGAYPRRDFDSFDLRSPRGTRVKWEDSCEGGYILFGPNGPSVDQPGPVMMDTNGELVWMTDEWGIIMDFNVQEYKGKNYLTFWYGHKAGSNGQGEMIMLDSNYKEAYRINAVGEGNSGDLHEFRLTKDGTALISIFNNTQADLTRMKGFRPVDGWLTDGMFQEVDIATNELLFEWRAIDHFKPEDTLYFDPFGGYFEDHPFDYYHLNSVEKDSKGNYLISSRHYHHFLYLDGKTGDVLWTLGGGSTDFVDLSDGLASDFQWQHNPRWLSEEEGLMSFLDNGVAGPLHVDAPYSKGKIIKMDVENRTVELVQDYISLNRVRAASQGNFYHIPENNHNLIGWGAIGAYSEFHMNGELLCEVHWGAAWLFWWERMKSYRVYRIWDWKGEPQYPPSTRIKGDQLYVSWNGATQVEYWELQGSTLDAMGQEDFTTIELAEKHTFEHAFDLPSDGEYDQYRVAALDGEKNVLHYSEAAERVSGMGAKARITAFIGAGIVLGLFMGVMLLCGRRILREGVRGWHALIPTRRRDGYQYSKLLQ